MAREYYSAGHGECSGVVLAPVPLCSSYYSSGHFFWNFSMKLCGLVALDKRISVIPFFLTLTFWFKVKVTSKFPLLKVYFGKYDTCVKFIVTL